MLESALAALGRALAGASLTAALAALALAVLLLPLRRLPPGWKAWLWWLVAARALIELAGVPAWSWAVLPAREPATIAFAATVVLEPATLAAPARAASPAVAPELGGLDPWALGGALWLLGTGGGLALAARAAARLRGVVRRAEPLREPAALAVLERVRAAVRLDRPVELRTSAEIESPMAAGLLRPAVLLPAQFAMSDAELELVLLHELTHLRRLDGWRALVPALAGRLFFFHPLVRRAEREFALAVEAACDAAVVAHRAAPAERYGRLLVRFAAGASPAGAWPLATSPIRRRLDMLVQGSFDRRRLAAVLPLVGLLAIALVMPVRLVATASAPPTPPPTPSAWAAGPPDPPELPDSPTPAPAPAPAAAARPRPAAPPRIPAPAFAPLPVLPPVPPNLDAAGADWLVLVDGESRLVMNAPGSEVRRAARLAAERGRAVLLVGRDGKSHLTDDPRAIDALRGVVEGQREAALEQARLAREHAHAASEEGRAAAEAARRYADGDLRRLERLAGVEADRMARLAEEMSRLGEAMPRLQEERWQALAAQMAELEGELAGLREELEGARFERLEDLQLELGERRRRTLEERELELRRLTREREESARRAGEELGRVLRQLFEDGSLAPVEPR